jgi:ADP-ribose pyrophosphatase YjhB (NUDIX family)/predicted aspartyl protease
VPEHEVSDREHEKGQTVAGYIRPLALVVFRRDDGRILVAPGFDHVKQQRFYRPLGGGIEFGERAEEAARREIREELGAEIDGLHLLGVFENIFTYLGQPGHELAWLYEARFTDPRFYAEDVVIADEEGAKFEVHWVPLDVFERREAPLYPDGMLDLLTSRNASEGYYEKAMSLTHVEVEIANQEAPDRAETIRLLVDSGAIRSVVPRTLLDRLGVRPFAEDSYILANGDKITRSRGAALFKYRGRVGVSEVIFGEPGDSDLLGALTLEALGLSLNPLTRELYDLPILLA